ncbi:MAG: hypothetical protein Athens101428_639 [Candidatus Berkelbacteria bacterium Athens1014_28]|uniref:Uncharacterized protein n=1 Tax=Candidatus Berkelbacteria bacterium Athens1014_28 TaxID=2017145 RepID=A0A554LL27_9BACT|nr:MAG: hypothetical protein Athens101428_639 [Candidatus Berkelbacteria bacterium Athens1014_28]
MEGKIIVLNIPRGEGSTNVQLKCNDEGQVDISEGMALQLFEEILEGFPGLYQRFVEQNSG